MTKREELHFYVFLSLWTLVPHQDQFGYFWRKICCFLALESGPQLCVDGKILLSKERYMMTGGDSVHGKQLKGEISLTRMN